MKSVTVALGLILLGSQACMAHDKWSNGSPLPDWVKSSCCGPSDAHHLRPDQVHDEGDYYRVDGYTGGNSAGRIWKLVNGMGEGGKTIQVPNPSLIPSQDGDYWIFYNDHISSMVSGMQSNIYCFFIPFDF